MIPPPTSSLPLSDNQLFSSQDHNQLPFQMQGMKLGPPLSEESFNKSPNVPQMTPGIPSPLPNRSLGPTTVTYSNQPGATYPYVNNNPPLGSGIIRPEPHGMNQNQMASPIQNVQPRYSNGISNGHEDPGLKTFQSYNTLQAPSKQSQQPQSSSPAVLQPRQMQFNHPQAGIPNSPQYQPGLPNSPAILPQTQTQFPPPHQNSLGMPQQIQSRPQLNFQVSPQQMQAHQQPGLPNSPSVPQQRQMQYQQSQTGLPNSPAHFRGGPPSTSYSQQFSNQNVGGPSLPMAIPQPGFQPYVAGSPSANFQPPGGYSQGSSPYSTQNQQFGVQPPTWGSSQFQGAGAPGNYPYGAPNQDLQQQQQKKLDLDQMPSAVQVREEDRKMKSGYYTTDVKGQIPPLVTTDFLTQDRGLCSPHFIRSSLYCLPNNPDMLKQTGIPFAITINPLAHLPERDVEPPACLYRESGPLRCKRCKAYICPFMTFMEGGRVFQCAFCKVVTEVPQDYFCFLDNMGERTDKYHRPELCLGSYEYQATKEYCRKDELPNPPAYIFMMEVSSSTFRNGLIPLLCENMKNVLQCLKNDEKNDNSKLRVGFVTYNNVLHFYNMKKNLSQPHIMVLSDVHNAFVPLLEGFLVTLDEAEALVESLMEHIPRLFINEPTTEIILGPVIQVGLEALKNANCSGKLLVFHSTIPNAEAPGKLPHREGQKLLGTEKQKIALAPQTDFYSKLAQDCVAAGCAVDLFLFPNAFVDIPSLSPLCRHTGGQLYKYTYFQSHVDGDRFLEDLEQNITTPTAYDAVLRVRSSAGISPVFYYGNFFMSNATDIELSAIDCYKTVTVEFAYDDKLPENETVFIQAALLYTTRTGERRIRCHNFAIPTTVSLPDVFRSCELDTTINFFAKQALKQLLDHGPQQIKNGLISRSAKILSCYRKNCATSSASVQLILPDSMKLLPLYINSLLKSDAISGGPDMSLDDRSFAMLAVNSMDVKSTAIYFYPSLIPLHEVDPNTDKMPTFIRCSIEKLNDNGVYLLENGIYMFLWIGQAVSSDWLQNVLGVQSTNQVDKQKTSLPELNNQLSIRIRQIIEDLQERRQWYMRLTIMVKGDKLEIVFRQFLVEDRGSDGSASYVDFLCHLHREISKH